MNKNHHVFPLQINNAQSGGEPQTIWHRQGRQSSHLWEPDANQTAINCPKENISAHLSRKSIRKKEEVLHIRSIRIIRSFTVYFKNGFRWPKKLVPGWLLGRRAWRYAQGIIPWSGRFHGIRKDSERSNQRWTVEPLKIHLTSSHQRLAWVFFSEFGGGHLRSSTFLDDDANNEITAPGKRWHKAVTILVSVYMYKSIDGFLHEMGT